MVCFGSLVLLVKKVFVPLGVSLDCQLTVEVRVAEIPLLLASSESE